MLSRLDAMAVGLAAWRLGAGRARKEDPVQAGAGVEIHARPGDAVTAGQPLLTLHTDEPARFDRALASLEGGFDIAGTRPGADPAGPGTASTTGREARARGGSPRQLTTAQPGSSRTTVSATQAGLATPSISMT